VARQQLELERMRLLQAVGRVYVDLQIDRARINILNLMDSIYANFSRMAERRFELGETNFLEKATSSAKQQQVRLALEEALQKERSSLIAIAALVQAEDSLVIETVEPERLMPVLRADTLAPQFRLFEEQESFANLQWQLEKQRLLPDISFEYFWGSNSSLSGTLNGYSVGLGVPLLFSGQSSRIKASRLAVDVTQQRKNDLLERYRSKRKQLELELAQSDKALSYFESDGQELARAIFLSSESAYRNGEIDFFQYIQSLENAYEIGIGRLEALRRYNQVVIQLNYLIL
jgi:cobalt-zinc-cadmium resistance protein CzcA